MKQKTKYVLCSLFAVFCILSQSGCGGKEPVSDNTFMLNTTCSIRLFEAEGSKQEQEQLIADTFDLCRSCESQLSRTIDGSDISRLNKAAGAETTVDAKTAELIAAALEYSRLTEGRFDITVGELAELWNFSGDDPHVPADEAIQAAVTHVDYKKVRLFSAETMKTAGAGETGQTGESNGAKQTVQLLDPSAKLDLGGIAKGYIEDQAAAYLRERGVKSAILDFGGSILCIGEKKEGTPFTIGIEKPFSGENGEQKEILASVQVKDQVIATSGIYERKFYENGKLYHHVLDPKTGYPCETDLDSVTIIGPKAVDCDGLSTSCILLGRDRAAALIESLPEYEAIFVGRDGTVTATSGASFQEAQQQ